MAGYFPKYDIPAPDFLKDLKFGEQGEELIAKFIGDIASGDIEVKTDRYRNGKMVIETEQWPGRRRTPDGKETNLLTLPHYNFGWQRDYYFRDPIDIPAGSMLIARYTFDNSTRNPANPDPNRVVPWGDQSFDEMLYTAIRYRWIDETATKQLPQYDRQMVRGMGEPPRT